MVLCILLWIVVLWKNLVIFSPSFNHLILDFCFQSISSCFLLYSSCVRRSCSWFTSVLVLPPSIIFCWSSTILCSSIFWPWKMLLKVEWFHFLIFFLRFFSQCLNWNIIDPSGGVKFSQAKLTIFLKSGCERQKVSNWKGFMIESLGIIQWSKMGQWSEPNRGRIEAMMSPPKCMELSEIRNLSSREEICWDPDLLLFQV